MQRSAWQVLLLRFSALIYDKKRKMRRCVSGHWDLHEEEWFSFLMGMPIVFLIGGELEEKLADRWIKLLTTMQPGALSSQFNLVKRSGNRLSPFFDYNRTVECTWSNCRRYRYAHIFQTTPCECFAANGTASVRDMQILHGNVLKCLALDFAHRAGQLLYFSAALQLAVAGVGTVLTSSWNLHLRFLFGSSTWLVKGC